VLNQPLCFAADLISIIRLISVNDKKLWDEVFPLNHGQLSYLKSQLRTAIENDWIVGALAPIVTSTLLLFSDASKLRMGAVLTNDVGKVIHIWPRRFPAGFESAHIYLKELGAIVWYVIAIVNLLEIANVKIIVVTDNSAAYFAL
jgi:hypothetical protein